MARTRAELRRIYDRTSGYCHLCRKKLSFANYGRVDGRGAWHVEHSVPRAKGGTDHANNLYAACITCNLDKSTVTTKTVRGWNGRTRAPLSRRERRKARTGNAVAGGVIGGILGSILGPLAAVIGAGIGAKVGHDVEFD
jgi:5-methylcytosine-specific restriction endonuclease McrA